MSGPSPDILSATQLNRLGDRLRDSAEISADDLMMLQAYLAEHEEALIGAMQRVAEALPDIDATSRVKTVQTLVDKLKRQTIRLTQVQDIAGIRIVQDTDLQGQDEIIRTLRFTFPGAKVVDRRMKPTHGYRAVHAIVPAGRCWVEIQVRTRFQHSWAQIVERLADRWGRQIRYGGSPDVADMEIGHGMTRADLWDLTLDAALDIADIETEILDGSLMVRAGVNPEEIAASGISERHQRVQAVLRSLDILVSLHPGL